MIPPEKEAHPQTGLTLVKIQCGAVKIKYAAFLGGVKRVCQLGSERACRSSSLFPRGDLHFAPMTDRARSTFTATLDPQSPFIHARSKIAKMRETFCEEHIIDLTVTLKSLQRTKLQHPHQINLHPDLHTSDLVKTD